VLAKARRQYLRCGRAVLNVSFPNVLRPKQARIPGLVYILSLPEAAADRLSVCRSARFSRPLSCPTKSTKAGINCKESSAPPTLNPRKEMPLNAGSPQDSKSTRTPGSWTQILLLEDNSARANRRSAAGFRRPPDSDVVLRFHRIENDAVSVAGESAYAPGTLDNSGARGGRSTLALQLLDSIGAYPQETLVVAGPNYGGNQRFTDELQRRGFNWTVELPRNAVMRTEKNSSGVPIMSLLSSAKWKSHDIVSPGTGNILTYAVAHLGYVPLTDGVRGRLFAAQTGAINGVHKGTIIGFSSIATTALDDLLRAVGWARWIRPLVRLEERRLFTPRREPEPSNRKTHVELAARSNIKLSRQHDESASRNGDREDLTPCTPRKVLSKGIQTSQCG
jgi:hypothetical protein